MDAWIVWLIVGVLLVALEVMSQMVWTLCMAVGCMGGLIASLCGVDAGVQIIVMAVTSIVAFIALMPLFKKWHEKHGRLSPRDDRTGMDALLGRKAVVTEAIMPGMMGRARIDGDNWQVKAPGADAVVLPGSEVSVTAYDGNILTVAI
ncbi:MAG: NfeD family protein [Bacteroidales bacterium]|nr:NfeD family protein [Bacteroidales bacterium]